MTLLAASSDAYKLCCQQATVSSPCRPQQSVKLCCSVCDATVNRPAHSGDVLASGTCVHAAPGQDCTRTSQSLSCQYRAVWRHPNSPRPNKRRQSILAECGHDSNHYSSHLRFCDCAGEARLSTITATLILCGGRNVFVCESISPASVKYELHIHQVVLGDAPVQSDT